MRHLIPTTNWINTPNCSIRLCLYLPTAWTLFYSFFFLPFFCCCCCCLLTTSIGKKLNDLHSFDFSFIYGSPENCVHKSIHRISSHFETSFFFVCLLALRLFRFFFFAFVDFNMFSNIYWSQKQNTEKQKQSVNKSRLRMRTFPYLFFCLWIWFFTYYVCLYSRLRPKFFDWFAEAKRN